MTLPPPQKKQKKQWEVFVLAGVNTRKTKGIGIWKKKKNGADRFFDWNPSELHVQGSQWLQVFPYFGGRLFPKRTFPITNISPPETNSDEKKSTCPFEVRPENSGALQLAGFREGLVSTDVQKMGSVEMAATGVFEA